MLDIVAVGGALLDGVQLRRLRGSTVHELHVHQLDVLLDLCRAEVLRHEVGWLLGILELVVLGVGLELELPRLGDLEISWFASLDVKIFVENILLCFAQILKNLLVFENLRI